MNLVRRTWVGSAITLLLVSLFLTGCPKRPEIAETAPKPIGPQGAMPAPAPPLPTPPTVSAVPPTVSAPPEEKSPAEVAAQPEASEAAPEAKVQETESPAAGGQAYQEPVTPAQEAQIGPEAGAAPPSETGEAEVKPEGQIREAEVKPEISSPITEPEVKTEAPAPITEAEVKPEAPSEVKEPEVTPGAGAQGQGAQVQGAQVGAAPETTPPSAGQPSSEGATAAAPAEPVAPAPVPTPPSPHPAMAEAPKAAELVVKDIFFDFDQAVIRDDSRKTLADNIQWFKANSAAKVTIEGHCDERGSSEYNLALGERRARVTRDFLVAAGIQANLINTISFGKERPFVLGHDESAWKWNRRAHFVLSPK